MSPDTADNPSPAHPARRAWPGVVVGLVLGGLAWWLPLSGTDGRTPTTDGAAAVDDESAVDPSSLRWVRRPLRGPLVNEPVEADAPPPGAYEGQVESAVSVEESPWPRVTLVGVSRPDTASTDGGAPRAVLGFFRGSGGRVKVLGEGETIDGVLVRELHADHAVLERDGETRQIDLVPPRTPASSDRRLPPDPWPASAFGAPDRGRSSARRVTRG
ncbi:MAG: hypothetical protein AAFX76_12485 [Planctomycetota bacterium]